MKKQPFKTNSDEFEFGLSTHGAWMLISGMQEYLKLINRLFKQKVERADYCFLMTHTLHEQAIKLREWAVKNDININIPEFDKFMDKIKNKKEQFRVLDQEICRKELKKAT